MLNLAKYCYSSRVIIYLCILDCDSGTWGVNCANNCGQCHSGTVCDAVNGECQLGCKPGWKGHLCNESKFK